MGKKEVFNEEQAKAAFPSLTQVITNCLLCAKFADCPIANCCGTSGEQPGCEMDNLRAQALATARRTGELPADFVSAMTTSTQLESVSTS
jgi:hypothetical protein